MSEHSHEDDVAFIRALAELLRQNDLTELEVKREYGGESALNVRVSRNFAASPAALQAPAQNLALPGIENGAGEPDAPADPADHPGVVTSPMVGTVYYSPEPGADPFVRPGTQVSEGQTVLIVEAMKTMNHIHAPRSGKIKDILVPDGSPVEYGAPLLIIE